MLISILTYAYMNIALNNNALVQLYSAVYSMHSYMQRSNLNNVFIFGQEIWRERNVFPGEKIYALKIYNS